MKKQFIFKIFIVVIILIITASTFFSDTRFRFGNVILTDTLAGSLLISSGDLYSDKVYYASEVTTQDNYFQMLYNDVTGRNDFIFTSPVSQASMNYSIQKANGMFRFYIGTENTLVTQIDSTAGIKATSGVTFPSGDVSNPDLSSGDVKVYVYDKKLIFECNDGLSIKYFYLDFTTESDQTLIYSATKP
jgi:hypothetical protein